MPDPDSCLLFLIRHAATANNRARPPILQGRRTDPGLSPEGVEQAEQTARFLADYPLDAVFSSPLRRAMETAAAIALPHGLKVLPDGGFIEADVGEWEGLSWDKIEKRFPDEYRAFMANPVNSPYRGGESIGDVQRRTLGHFERLGAENLGKNIVLVAHNVVNRAYIAHLTEISVGKYRSVPQSNCGINLLRYRDGKMKVLTINGRFHRLT